MKKNIIKKIIEDTIKLVNIKSVKDTPTENHPFGKEVSKALDFTLQLAESMGFSCNNYDNYIGECMYGSGEKTFAVLCHLDVMPATGFESAFNAKIIDNKLVGRGVLDDKCPTVAILHILNQLKEEGIVPRHKIKVIFGLDEESGWNCINHYKKLKGEIADFGIAPDADFPVIYAEKGIIHFDIQFPFYSEKIKSLNVKNRYNAVPDYASATLNGKTLTKTGKPAHASTPNEGDNALIKIIKEINKYEDNKILEFLSRIKTDGSGLNLNIEDEKSGKLTLNVANALQTDTHLTIGFDVRYPVSFKKENILNRIKCVIPKGAEVILKTNQDPLYVDKNSNLIKTLLSSYNKFSKTNEEALAIGGGTYARALKYAVAFGPVRDNNSAHTDHEYMTLDEIEFMCDVYYDALKKILTSSYEELIN